MKNRVIVMAVGVVGLCGMAMGVPSMDGDAVLALVDSGKTGEALSPFSCGATCNGIWVTVNTCYGNQKCCGYIFCSTGVSFGTCCSPGQHCSWDGTGTFPGSVSCVANP